jgi:hypothetical protein
MATAQYCTSTKLLRDLLAKALKGTQAGNVIFPFFCRNRILMVPRACNTGFLKIVFDLGEILEFKIM